MNLYMYRVTLFNSQQLSTYTTYTGTVYHSKVATLINKHIATHSYTIINNYWLYRYTVKVTSVLIYFVTAARLHSSAVKQLQLQR